MKALTVGVVVALVFAVTPALAQTPSPATLQWGQPGDLPIVGDFDGDGHADVTVFRPSTGAWYLRLSSQAFDPSGVVVHWGQLGDVPIPADYDHDGITDIAVYRPATGTWHITYSGLRPQIIQGFSRGTELRGTAAAFTVYIGANPASDGTIGFASESTTDRRCVAAAGGGDPSYAVAVGVLALGGQRIVLFAPEGQVFQPFTRITVICR